MFDFISTNPVLASAITGAVMYIVACLVKKTGLPSKYIVAGLTVLVGVGYTAFTKWVPVEVQENIVAFASTALATSWAIYEMIHKPAKAKMIEAGIIQE